MYLGEGESRKTDENAPPPIGGFDDSTVSSSSSRDSNIMAAGGRGFILKGHEFFQLSFHMPTTCDGCGKALWAIVRPPPAMECKLCRLKFHREHVIGSTDAGVAPCKVSYDPTAKDMLLMAASKEEQQLWVGKLMKKIQKSGYKASTLAAGSSLALANESSSTNNSSRVSPQEMLRKNNPQSSSSSSGSHSLSAASGANFILDSNRHQKSSTLPGGNSNLSTSSK